MSIIGIEVRAVDVASDTLIQAARAKFSMPLAPGQNPEAAMEAVREHLQSHAPFGVTHPGS